MEGKKDIRKWVLFQLAFSKFSKFLILNVWAEIIDKQRTLVLKWKEPQGSLLGDEKELAYLI